MKTVLKFVGSIVATGVLWEYLLKPIIDLCLSYSGTIWGTIVDYYFYCCARANTEKILIEIAIIGAVLIYFTPIIGSTSVIRHIKKDLNKLDTLKKSIENGKPLEIKKEEETYTKKIC